MATLTSNAVEIRNNDSFDVFVRDAGGKIIDYISIHVEDGHVSISYAGQDIDVEKQEDE